MSSIIKIKQVKGKIDLGCHYIQGPKSIVVIAGFESNDIRHVQFCFILILMIIQFWFAPLSSKVKFCHQIPFINWCVLQSDKICVKMENDNPNIKQKNRLWTRLIVFSSQSPIIKIVALKMEAFKPFLMSRIMTWAEARDFLLVVSNLGDGNQVEVHKFLSIVMIDGLETCAFPFINWLYCKLIRFMC